ncbi:Hypothetical protein PHPALM_9657 [Phytophthora palmivora]|uniref:SAP domain-containing protein n=1 Tax=Phytophthora palmivora TaxID=4796 RepID=A0A2P4Y6Q9_9STRA|nr:Hypothetical protein PHPALM_9657 [Phytophthora palmivora]
MEQLVKDLQRELKKRGLDTSGLKAVLLQRLKEHLQQTKAEDVEQEKEKAEKGDDGEQGNEKDEPVEDQQTENNKEAGEKPTGKRSAEDEEDAPDAKKPKVEAAVNSPQPEDEDDKPTSTAEANNEKAQGKTEMDHRTTLRIDNFVRPFTLNAVKALVQELGNFVDDGFWMDAIKTHCFVTYSSDDAAKKTSAALDGKVWPPENGRALSVKFVDHTAMEVSQYGESNLPSRPKRKNSNEAPQPTQRQKVTIDEFFQKTETKPVLYYLPLTDEQIKEKKQRQSQQPEGQPRKRRHRGGRKRNRRARFQRR